MEFQVKNKEAFLETQTRFIKLQRQYNTINQHVLIRKKERQYNLLTLEELNTLPEKTVTYRQVGKAFLCTPLKEIVETIDTALIKNEKDTKKIDSTKAVVEKQLADCQKAIEELIITDAPSTDTDKGKGKGKAE